jgi:hypothetical protein
MKIGRRMFLQSASSAAVLAIPCLQSLWPRRARAQAALPSVRYVQWATDHGVYADRFWPKATPVATSVAGVRAQPLSEIAGRLSEVLDASWDPLRSKVNLVRGLDLMVSLNYHNACVPTCATWPREDNHLPFFAHSVDSVLADSTKVYPATVRVPALRLTPGVNSSYKWGSFCWTTRNGSSFKLPCFDKTQTAFESVFGAGTAPSGSTTGVDATVAARVRLTDQVIGDYRQVVNGRVISTADRQQLNDYMDLLADVQSRMQIEAPECTAPSQLSESDFDVLHQNAIDIAVAAMLCNSTRVVAYHAYQGSPSSYDEETFHAWAHDDANRHSTMQAYRYRQLARLIARMDMFTESNGQTLLSNSLVYANNELSDPQHGGTHLKSMPVITAGTAGGQLVTGQYIDFGGRLMNSMLVTAFTAMGLEPADYERNGVAGFGDYEGRESEKYAAYVSPAERRKPLPYLFK